MMKCAEYLLFFAVVAALAAPVHAQEQAAAPAAKASGNDQPIEISSDKLDVYQDEHKAIFTGNVIAVQGTSTMRSAKMTVYYHGDDAKAAPGAAKPPAKKSGKAADSTAQQGIYRIDAEDNVVFTTPTETAQGDLGIYRVEEDTIDLTGKIVTLTREGNVLKGRSLNYNLGTGRSIFTAGDGTKDVSGAVKPGRVHGLFVPKPKPGAAAKPVDASKPGDGSTATKPADVPVPDAPKPVTP